MRTLIFITLFCTGLTLKALEENARAQMPPIVIGMDEQNHKTITFANKTSLKALIVNTALPSSDFFESEPEMGLHAEKGAHYREVLVTHFAGRSVRLDELRRELIRCQNSKTSFREAKFEDEMRYKYWNQQFYEIVVPLELRL